MLKKITACALALICLMAMCGVSGAEVTTKRTYTWETSEEAKEKVPLIVASNAKAELQKDKFDAVFSTFGNRPEQALPVVTTENEIRKETVLGSSVYSFVPESYDTIVLYIHGGAYIFGMDAKHVTFCDKLCSQLNVKVVLPNYPLAPENTFEKTYELLDTLYPTLVAEGKRIVIMGDSAGGGLSLAYTEYLAEKKMQCPDKMVLFSPWIDVTLSHPDVAEVNKRDILLDPYGAIIAGKAWAGTTSTADYRISPLRGNLDSLPDMLVFVSSDEIVCPDDMVLYNAVTNTNITMILAKGLWHVFPLSDIPELQKSIDVIADFLA